MISAIILSGGIGSRMGALLPKQYLPLAGKAIALYSYELLRQIDRISEVIVVCDPEYQSLFQKGPFALPGERRQDSLFNGLKEVSSTSRYVLVHDAARPLLKREDIESVINAAIEYGAATLATPVIVTIKQANPDHLVIYTPPRSTLYNIQTPQVLDKEILLNGFKKAHEQQITVTDDVSLAELIGHPVKLVMGCPDNIKVTTPEDLFLAENILIDYEIIG